MAIFWDDFASETVGQEASNFTQQIGSAGNWLVVEHPNSLLGKSLASFASNTDRRFIRFDPPVADLATEKRIDLRALVQASNPSAGTRFELSARASGTSATNISVVSTRLYRINSTTRNWGLNERSGSTFTSLAVSDTNNQFQWNTPLWVRTTIYYNETLDAWVIRGSIAPANDPTNEISVLEEVTSKGHTPNVGFATTLDSNEDLVVHALGVGTGEDDAPFENPSPPSGPILTFPAADSTSRTTAAGSVTTDTGRGTLYAMVTQDATPAVDANGVLDFEGAFWSTDQPVTEPGEQTFTIDSLLKNTTYWLHIQQYDDFENEYSELIASVEFTTLADFKLVYADTGPLYVTATSGSRTIPGDVQDGDIAVISYFHRSALTDPGGFDTWTEYANGGADQITGIATKRLTTADANATVTFTQSASGRLALHLTVLRPLDGIASVIGVVGAGGGANSIDMPPLTSERAFAVVSTGTDVYASGTEDRPYIDASSGSEWTKLDSDLVSDSRLSAAVGYFENETTPLLRWINSGTSVMATAGVLIIEGTQDWEQDPAVTDTAVDAIQFSYQSPAADDVSAVALLPGAPAPTDVQVAAGTDGADQPALAAATTAGTVNPATITLTGLQNPVYDIYVSYLGATPVAFLRAYTLPPAGKQYEEVADLPWPSGALSILQDANPAAQEGDVIEVDLVTSPGGFAITVFPDGTFVLGDDDDGSEQTFDANIWYAASGSWGTEQTFTVNADVVDPDGLVVQDIAHGHVAAAPTLAAEHGLNPASSIHAQAAGTLALTNDKQVGVAPTLHAHAAHPATLAADQHLLATQNTHGHNAGQPTLGSTHTLQAAASAHSHTTGTPTLASGLSLDTLGAQHGHTSPHVQLELDLSLTVEPAAHAQLASTGTLSAQHGLPIADTLHTHGAETLQFAAGTHLATAPARHLQHAGSSTLSTVLQVIVDSASHGHGAGTLGLAASLTLTVDGLTHAHRGEQANLFSGTGLAPVSTTHAQLAEVLQSSSEHSLATAGARHAQTADPVPLAAALSLLVDAALHQHGADTLALSPESSVLLTVAAAGHPHVVDSLELGAQLSLALSEPGHDHRATAAALSAVQTLAELSSSHGHGAGTLGLFEGFSLTITQALHQHLADGVDLHTAITLAVADAMHQHGAASAVLTALVTAAVHDALHDHYGERTRLYEALPLALQLRRSVFVRLQSDEIVARVARAEALARVEWAEGVTRLDALDTTVRH